jgi:4-amino-4-deoxy-L-arabinose transferase-like glycosyltransferase
LYLFMGCRGHRPDRLVVAVILLALLIRIAAVVYLRSYQISGDEDHWNFGFEAGRLARSLATGAGYSSPLPEPTGPSALLSPGYPLLLAGVFRLFGAYSTGAAVAALALNILFSTLTCAGVYLLGRRIFGRPTGILASAFLALYPPSIWYAATWIWDTSLLAFVLVAAMVWVYRLPEVPSLSRLAVTGGILGVVALINPAPIPFYAALAFLLWRTFRARSLNGTARIAVLAASCLLVYAPWLIRNWLVVGVLTPRTSAGMNLRLGNNERVWELATGGFDIELYPSGSREEFRQFHDLGEVGYDRRCQQLAMAFIRENPSKFAQLVWFRFRGWWFGPWTSRVVPPPALRWLAAVAPVLLLAAGCFFSFRNGKPATLVMALVLIYPLPYYLVFVASRYRFPMEPFMVLLGAYGIVSTWSWLRPIGPRLLRRFPVLKHALVDAPGVGPGAEQRGLAPPAAVLP